jgi:hypothetical protein
MTNAAGGIYWYGSVPSGPSIIIFKVTLALDPALAHMLIFE